jgi:hypothetical protein
LKKELLATGNEPEGWYLVLGIWYLEKPCDPSACLGLGSVDLRKWLCLQQKKEEKAGWGKEIV